MKSASLIQTILPALAIVSLSLPLNAQTPPTAPKPEWPKTMYACRDYGPLDTYGGTIEFQATFTETGELYSESAQWSRQIQPGDKSETPVRFDGGGQGWITIGWPNGNPWRKPVAGQDPAEQALVRINNFGLNRAHMRKSERWQQSIIARGGETLIANDKQDRLLITSPMEPVLASDLNAQMGAGLLIPVASLIAWGSGTEALTGYDVFVTPRKYRRNTYPSGPAGKLRIVGEYRIDTRLLARTFEAVRRRHAAWRKTLTDPQKTCQETQMEDPSMEIIVT